MSLINSNNIEQYKINREKDENMIKFLVSKVDNEETICYKSENNVIYRLFLINLTAKVIESPKASGDILIPTYIEYHLKQFKVISICDEAFKDSSIESISFSIDSKVQRIGNFAFENSTIRRLFIPRSLNILNKQWAQGANKLEEITIDDNNPYFSNESGFLIYKEPQSYEKENDSSKEILFAPRKYEGNLLIPEDVTKIGRFAFNQRQGLLSVKSETSSPKKIKSFCFFQCKNLQNICLKGQSDLLFGGCCFSQSERLSSIEISCKTIVIGKNCFENCSSLCSVNLNVNNRIVLGSNAFKGCSNLENFLIFKPSTIKIDDECFEDAINLKTATFVASSIILGSDIFRNCPMLSFITIESRDDLAISSSTFKYCNFKYIKLVTSSTLRLNDLCFNSKKVENIELAFRNITVGKNCFSECSSLLMITLQSEEEIEILDAFFIGCQSLKKLFLSSKSNIAICDHFMKESQNLEIIDISGRNILIGPKSFENCKELSCFLITHSDNVQFKENQFVNCDKLKEISIQSSIVNIHQNQISNLKSLKHIIIDSNSLINLGKNCFNGFDNLQSVLISSNKTHIGDACFSGCPLLKKFSISSAKNVVIGNNAFEKCKVLENVLFNVDGNLKIMNNCFSESQNLQSFSVLKSQNLGIGNNVFEDCKKLESVSLKAENKIILLNYCFSKAENLKVVDFSCNEIIFNENCFFGCTSLKNFKSHNADKVIFANQAFCYCDNLENVEISAKLEFLAGSYCFDRLINLKTVKIDSPKVRIGDFCFNSCTSLTSLSFPNVEEIIYYDSYIFDCNDVNIIINPKISKKEIKSEKLRTNKRFIGS